MEKLLGLRKRCEETARRWLRRARRSTATSPPLGGVSECFLWQVFGLAGSDLLARLPKRQALSVVNGVRTCLPLRGSSGVAPDSLFILRGRRNQWNEPTLSGGLESAQRYRLWISGDAIPQGIARCS